MASSREFVHPSLNLIEDSEFFYLIPNGSNSGEVLVIDRLTDAAELQFNAPVPALPGRTIYGILGRIRLVAGWYLVVVTERQLVSTIDSCEIWMVKKTDVIPYNKSSLHLTNEQIGENETYLSLIQMVLATDFNYFSTSYDVTHTHQRLSMTDASFLQQAMWLRADHRFLWNRHLLLSLSASSKSDLSKYLMPIVHGFFTKNCFTINGNQVDYSVFSRRNVNRAGTRLHVRGIDETGNVANFVESEAIVECNGSVASFVQTRGSIPLFWSQKPNIRLKPKPVLATIDHDEAFARHFEEQIQLYGRQAIVNLSNSTGAEGALGQELENLVNKSNNKALEYFPFDFHKETKGMRWDRLSKLLDMLQTERLRQRFWLRDSNGKILKRQEGVFRTNCIDCLDRTNVVQSLIAKQVLDQILTELGVLVQGTSVDNFESTHQVYRNMWVDNADVCSLQYAASPALKTDFSRTGARTKYGVMQDGIYSGMRYVKNNFNDGSRQDALDLFLGNYVVESASNAILASRRNTGEIAWKQTMPLIVLMMFIMIIVMIVIPADLPGTHRIAWVVFWIFAAGGTYSWMLMYYKDFVDEPRFVPSHKTDYFKR